MLQDIQVDLFLPDLKASSQTQVMELLARNAAIAANCPAAALLQCLQEKEMTSTFAIGDGVALPNLQLDNIHRPFKALAVLKTPVAFNAPDSKPVDFVCLMLSPEREGPLHLRRLARMSRLLKSPAMRSALREAEDLRALKHLLSDSQELLAA